MAVSQSLSLTLTSQSLVNNYSIVRVRWLSTQTDSSWNGYSRTAYYYVSKNGGAEEKYSVAYTLPKESTVAIIDLEIVVPHKADGTGSVKVRTWMDTNISAGIIEQTKTLALTTIPRKSTLTAGTGNLGEEMSLSVTKQADSFTHTITYKCGTASGTICTKASDPEILWTPPVDLAIQAPSANSVPITYTIVTYSGSTEIGSASILASCNIPYTNTYIPVLIFAPEDEMGYLDTYGGYVQGKSKLKIDITTYGAYGAWITSVTTEVDGSTYTGTSVISNVLATAGTLPVKVITKDSRGRTTEVTTQITVLPYEQPKVTALSAIRCDASGNEDSSGAYLLAEFTAEISSLNNNNTATYTIEYKKTTETDYIAVEQTNLEGQYSVDSSYIIPADTTSSYSVVLTAEDAFSQAQSATKGSSVKKVWSLLLKDGEVVGAAINKVAEEEGVFDINWKVKFSGGGDVVVEQGELDGWTYRKWGSGVMECWQILHIQTAIDKAWGSMYVGSTTMGRLSYPSPFISKPVENVTLQSGANAVWLFAESGGNGVNGGYASAIYNVCRPSAVSTVGDYYLSFYAVGKWK